MDDYQNITKDFEFLNTIMTNKINRYIVCNIEPKYFADSGPNRVTVTYDDTLSEAVDVISNDIVDTISENYFNFLSTKYFRKKEKLIEYIAETVYAEISSYIINKNLEVNKNFKSKQDMNEILAANKPNN